MKYDIEFLKEEGWFVNKDGSVYEISFKSYDERTIGSRLKPLAQKTLPFNYEVVKNEIVNYKEKVK